MQAKTEGTAGDAIVTVACLTCLSFLRYDALSKARTQHKDKTSLQLGRLAEKVREDYASDGDDTSLEKMRDELGGSADKLTDVIKSLYGFGDTAVEIFRRRMQADWEELYP